MNILLTPLMYLAGLGLILSLLVHVSSLLGIFSPFGAPARGLFVMLTIGAVPLSFPAVLAAIPLCKDFKSKDFWKAALRGCPAWLKYLPGFCFGYAAFIFILFRIMVDGGAKSGGGQGLSTRDIQVISASIMAVYSFSMATLYSAIQVRNHDQTRRCLNGHPVSPSAKFCGRCGSEVIVPRD
jgi:hypothetical protein